MNKTFEYHSLKTGRTVQLLHQAGSYFTCLIDVSEIEPKLLEVYEFDNLSDASKKVSEIIRVNSGINLKYTRHQVDLL